MNNAQILLLTLGVFDPEIANSVGSITHVSKTSVQQRKGRGLAAAIAGS